MNMTDKITTEEIRNLSQAILEETCLHETDTFDQWADENFVGGPTDEHFRNTTAAEFSEYLKNAVKGDFNQNTLEITVPLELPNVVYINVYAVTAKMNLTLTMLWNRKKKLSLAAMTVISFECSGYNELGYDIEKCL